MAIRVGKWEEMWSGDPEAQGHIRVGFYSKTVGPLKSFKQMCPMVQVPDAVS